MIKCIHLSMLIALLMLSACKSSIQVEKVSKYETKQPIKKASIDKSNSLNQSTIEKIRIAVLNLRSRAKLTESEVLFLSDTVRQASSLLDDARFVVMTRENINMLLPPNILLEQCEGSCEVELGRSLGAHYIVTGDLVVIGDSLRAQLRLHQSQSGALVSSVSAKGQLEGDFEVSLGEATLKLLSKIDARLSERSFPRPVDLTERKERVDQPIATPVTQAVTRPVSQKTKHIAPTPQESTSSTSHQAAQAHEWVLIYGEEFRMGSAEGEVDERPPHDVTLNDLYVTRSEVTAHQYERCVSAGVCTVPQAVSPFCTWGSAARASHPINCVTWDQARTYARWVGGDLPSEAQREFIASSRGHRRPFPWGQVAPSAAYVQSLTRGLAPVCAHPQGHSEQGVCDLAGSVWEWTLDEYRPYSHLRSQGGAVCSDVGCAGLASRVVRGGGWRFAGATLKVTTRSVKSKSDAFDDLGFRVVRPVLSR